MLLLLASHYITYVIELADPCQPRWKLGVEETALIRKQLHREENINESALNRMKISNWLWRDHSLHEK